MLKIAVIDDDLAVLDNILDTLEAEGFSTHGATNGTDGIIMIRKFKPHLVISDIMLPDIDGYQVLRELGKFPDTANIPFIFVTAKTDRDSLRLGMELGADDFITKPFTSDELLSAINIRINKQRAVEEIHESTIRLLKKNISYALPHELRTPLMNVLGYSDLILNEYEDLDTETLLEWVRQIAKGGKRLERVVENYLVYIQLELLDSPEQISLMRNNIVRDVQPIISGVANNTAQKFSREDDLSISVESMALRISNSDLRKIIGEFADNAFKFSNPNTPIYIEGKRLRNDYVIRIEDKGRGMSIEQINLMNAFMQFDREFNEQQGLGLGFIIAQKLIQLHQGDLVIASKIDAGTTLTIRFSLY